MNMLKKLNVRLIVLSFFVFNIGIANAQYYENVNVNKKSSVKDKLYFGGGIGLQFGTLTIIDLKPLIGYRITPKFNVGMQFTYSYIQNNTTQFSTDVYGGSIFTEYYIYEGIFAHAEIEALNMEYYDSNWELQRKWFDNYLVGGGYFQKMGQRGGVYFMILWNLNQNELSPYSNPLLTIGFTF